MFTDLLSICFLAYVIGDTHFMPEVLDTDHLKRFCVGSFGSVLVVYCGFLELEFFNSLRVQRARSRFSWRVCERVVLLPELGNNDDLENMGERNR